MMTRKQLIKEYLEFFKSKGHKEIPNESLIPENDPTVLFTTAGMHPLVPYLLGQKHPLGKRVMNVQRCVRTGDIEEVGNSTHHTFFEMIGNWSFGDYFKKEAIEWSFEFAVNILGLKKNRLAVSVFEGNEDAPKDAESAKIWESLGISKKRIAFLPKSENWWGPAGKTGPCGPCTEMFYWKDNSKIAPEKFNPNDENWVEIWNDVLMQYIKDSDGNYNPAIQKNIDNGRGLERVLAVINQLEDNYLSEVWKPIINQIEKISGKKYHKNEKAMRIIADHIKASVFILADGVLPSNTEQGYVLRRLIRRAIKYGMDLNMKNFVSKIAEHVFVIYDDYRHLQKNKKQILKELEKEEKRFEGTLGKGIKKLEKFLLRGKNFCGKDAFLLYQSYGFPIEMIQEECEKLKVEFPEKECRIEFEKHQEISRTATEGRFKSGLADNSEATTKLHTATHLLLAALRDVLKDQNILQKGSNITAERLRLDFNFPRKLTKEELKKVEDLVNAQVQNSCEILVEEMAPEHAKEKGALGIFDKKYGEKVTVYTIGDLSKEICAGPHVKNTCELGRFKIQKEESSSLGVRRIRAVLE